MRIVFLQGFQGMARRAPAALYNQPHMTARDRRVILLASLAAGLVLLPVLAEAHGVTRRDAAFVQSIDGPAVGPFLYLGAKHMVTGYDHLLFLVGVIFFLYRLKDVIKYRSEERRVGKE